MKLHALDLVACSADTVAMSSTPLAETEEDVFGE